MQPLPCASPRAIIARQLSIIESNLATHYLETGWSPDTGDMRAYCRQCETSFEATCSDLTWAAIRESERNARAPFGDYRCPKQP